MCAAMRDAAGREEAASCVRRKKPKFFVAYVREARGGPARDRLGTFEPLPREENGLRTSSELERCADRLSALGSEP